MLEQGKALLNILLKRGFEAYFIGGRCRDSLNNEFHESRVPLGDVDIVTSATVSDISSMFPSAKIINQPYRTAIVNFGGSEFTITVYDRAINRQSDADDTGSGSLQFTLNGDCQKRDFTINAIAQDASGEYLDFEYKYRNKKISALNDLRNKIIRLIGSPKQRLEEDPSRILRAFRFMSQLGYEFDKNTLQALQSQLHLLENLSHEQFGSEINKIITGPFAYSTILFMKQLGFFDLEIYNSISGKHTHIIPDIDNIPTEHLAKLTSLNLHIAPKLSAVEVWAFLLQPLGSDRAVYNLQSFYPLDDYQIGYVEWLIQYFDLVDSPNYKTAIYRARTGIVQQYRLMCLKKLLLSLCGIHRKLRGVQFQKVEKEILDAFCVRPYFEEQITFKNILIDTEEELTEQIVAMAKERIIEVLVDMDLYPDNEEYSIIVNNCIKEVTDRIAQ